MTEDLQVRVVLADHSHEVLSGLRLLFEQEIGAEVVGEARDSRTLEAVVGRSDPNVVLLDWNLAASGSTEAVARLRAGRASLRVIALSRDPEDRVPALEAGVDGFLNKAESPELLVALVRKVFAGGQESAKSVDKREES